MWIKVIKNSVTRHGIQSWSLVQCEYVNGKEIAKRVDRSQYDAFGIPISLNVDQARAMVKQLREKDRFEKTLKKKAATVERIKDERTLIAAFLPEFDIQAFEKQVLAPKYMGSEIVDTTNKVYIRWRAAMKVMAAVALDPSEYGDRYFVVYNELLRRSYSPDYCDRIIGLMNEYGYFYCRRYQKPFLPMSKLTKRNREKQADQNRKTSPSKKSVRITPKMLKAAEKSLKPDQYLWLLASVWFGLRPEEVDLLNLKESEYSYRLEAQGKTTVLCVYQPKLKMLPDEQRWKRIPLFLKEQREVLKRIEKEEVKRPLVKTLRKFLGPKVGTYGGRKGFTDLMKSHGQQIENISQWMGHTSLDRTMKDYKDKAVVHFHSKRH